MTEIRNPSPRIPRRIAAILINALNLTHCFDFTQGDAGETAGDAGGDFAEFWL